MTTNSVTITAPEGVPFIDIVREFDAPISTVYRAYSESDLVKQWLGPLGYEMQIERYDVRTGGGYRYVHISDTGEKYTFNGVFHVARENDLIIQTFEFEGFPDTVSIESARFEDLGDNRCRVVVHSAYPSLEARDGMIASDMEKGVTEGYQRLDELLTTL
ncbi:SRPBCC family protein [Glaciihabitans sp. UYNi722]|uniref:SRPBCC family protein n=1 Tax=Glaciihabitans sp. UYNi722 TaxID=3156344 RepID=UPI0033936D6E